MALRFTWYPDAGGTDHAVTVYWIRPDDGDWRTGYVARALGVMRLWWAPVVLEATEDELARWSAAATECVDALGAADVDFRPAQQRRWRWHDWPLVRRWAQAGYDRAAAVYLERVRTVAAAYRPVRDVVEHRIAELEGGRLAEGRRLYEEQERRREEAETRFREWERRQETADLPLPGGRTPRALAAAGEQPSSWPAEVVDRVGDDVIGWWAGIRAAVRNERALAQAEQSVLDAVAATAAALDEAGRPGIVTTGENRGVVLQGWWLDFGWPRDLRRAARLRTPPDAPVGHLLAGSWGLDLYLPARVLFVASSAHRDHRFATESTESVGYSTYTRKVWWQRDSADFVRSLFPVWATYAETYGSRTLRFPIAGHADPAAYVPHVEAVAAHAAAALRALLADQPRP